MSATLRKEPLVGHNAMEKRELLLFEVDGHRFGVLSSTVQELIRAVAVTRLPGKSREHPGVIDLRGCLIDVLDLRSRLGLPWRDLIPSDQLIIINTNDGVRALPVDRASELVSLPVSSAQETRRSASQEVPIEAVARHPDGPIPVLAVNSICTWSDIGMGTAPGQSSGLAT